MTEGRAGVYIIGWADKNEKEKVSIFFVSKIVLSFISSYFTLSEMENY